MALSKRAAFYLFSFVYLVTAVLCWVNKAYLIDGIDWAGDVINLVINIFSGNILATIILSIVVFLKTTVLTFGWILATLKVSWLKYLFFIPVKHIAVYAYKVSNFSKKITGIIKRSIKKIWQGFTSYGFLMIIYGLPSVSLLLLVLTVVSLVATGIRLFLTAKLGDKLVEIFLVYTVKYLPFTAKFLNPIKNFITRRVEDIEGDPK